MSELLTGVCCQFCVNFEGDGCPVKSATPWSRWGNWCSEYEPNPDEPDAKTIEEAFAARAGRKQP